MQVSEIDKGMQLAAINHLPAVIVHPQLVTEALGMRIRRNGKFKIITTVDWPKGEIYGMNKLRGLTRQMMGIDGYEIMMTGGKTEIENRNEASVITNFIKGQVSPMLEIRFVLGCALRPEAEVLNMAKVMKDVQAPTLIRTDTHLKTQVTKANQKTYTALMESLRTVCALPIKVSGNIDSVRAIAGCMQIPEPPVRFAVNLQQLEAILKDLQKQPNELRELLASASEAK